MNSIIKSNEICVIRRKKTKLNSWLKPKNQYHTKKIKVNPTDNVAVALVNLTAGELINFESEGIAIESDVKTNDFIPWKRGVSL